MVGKLLLLTLMELNDGEKRSQTTGLIHLHVLVKMVLCISVRLVQDMVIYMPLERLTLMFHLKHLLFQVRQMEKLESTTGILLLLLTLIETLFLFTLTGEMIPILDGQLKELLEKNITMNIHG